MMPIHHATSRMDVSISQHLPQCKPWRAIEFYAGLGGFSCAWPECEIAASFDISQPAALAYEHNWRRGVQVRAIESLNASEVANWDANFWWLSPPCQPFSVRGKQRDLDDARTASLLHLIELLPECLPIGLGLENVPGFEGSRTHHQLCSRLQQLGYQIQSRVLCPSETGWPNRRRRFYLLASRHSLKAWRPLPSCASTLQELVSNVLQTSSTSAEELALNQETVNRFGTALDRLDLHNPSAVAACFGSSYGKSIKNAGSYVVDPAGAARYFAPEEVLAILGFPRWFQFPVSMPLRQRWKLAGNSLSILAVRYILSHLPSGPEGTADFNSQHAKN